MTDGTKHPVSGGEPLSEPTAAPGSRPSWGPLVLMAYIAVSLCSLTANATWARFVNSDPEILLMLSSRNRYLALSLASGISIVAYAGIAFTRVVVEFMVCHFLGRAYAGEAVGWLKKYLGFTDAAEQRFDRSFGKAGWFLIPFFNGSNTIGVLSGVSRTPVRKVLPLLMMGIAGRLLLVWWLARRFEEQLVDLLETVARYQWWVIGASVALAALATARKVKQTS